MADQLSKYHQEKAGSSSGGAASSKNPQVVDHSGTMPAMENMGNPMMNMSGSKKVPGGMGETDSKNPMMPVSGGGMSKELPTQGEVYETNPQGHKQAPLAGKLLGKR